MVGRNDGEVSSLPETNSKRPLKIESFLKRNESHLPTIHLQVANSLLVSWKVLLTIGFP